MSLKNFLHQEIGKLELAKDALGVQTTKKCQDNDQNKNKEVINYKIQILTSDSKIITDKIKPEKGNLNAQSINGKYIQLILYILIETKRK